MAIPNDITAPYNDPAIQTAQQEAQTAGTAAVGYQSAASLLPAKLKEAVLGKVEYNKDIIEAKNKAQSEYFAAPAQAREQYQNIWNPFQRENLVTQARQQAYLPYANLSDILQQRMGSLADIINAATGAFQSQVTAKQGAYEMARQKLADLMGTAETKSGLSKWWYEQTHKGTGKASESEKTAAALKELRDDIQRGATLGQVIQAYSDTFTPSEIYSQYNLAGSPYGTAQEDPWTLYSKYGILMPGADNPPEKPEEKNIFQKLLGL